MLVDGRPVIPWHVAVEIFEHTFRVVGRVCDSHGCSFLALFTCYWPGQTCVKCPRCAHGLGTVAIALGFEMQTRMLDVPAIGIGEDDTSIRFSLLEPYP